MFNKIWIISVMVISIVNAIEESTAKSEDLTISWRLDGEYSVWAENCDFPYNDIEGVKVSKWNCVLECYNSTECTHFTWSQGNCWLKRGEISIEDAFYHDGDVICGVMHDEHKDEDSEEHEDVESSTKGF
jgi:hypothetical protein